MHSGVPDRGYFGSCSNYLPLLFTRIYNATRNVIEIDNDQILVSSDFVCIFIIFILLI
jgi:hypothetical protein